MLSREQDYTNSALDLRLLVQNDIQQRAVDFRSVFDAAVVFNEAELAKFVHEETHARPRRSDHLRKRLLADFGDNRLRPGFLAEIRQQQEHAGEPFLAGIEQLIDEVGFDADGPAQKMSDEHLGESRLAMDQADDGRILQADDDGVRHGRDRRHPLHLSAKTSLAEEFLRSQDCDDGFFALLRNDGDLHLALPDIEDRIANLPLGKDDLAFAVLGELSPVADTGEERFWIE